ncbi:hypothetical protein HUJ04_009097 [Dendroctonus ponderosae]|nr:hypothetical protein HUJ04_009097 [Dendroctonus ponderosae]
MEAKDGHFCRRLSYLIGFITFQCSNDAIGLILVGKVYLGFLKIPWPITVSIQLSLTAKRRTYIVRNQFAVTNEIAPISNKTNQNNLQLKDSKRLDNDALATRPTVTSLIDSHIEQPVTSLSKAAANQSTSRD